VARADRIIVEILYADRRRLGFWPKESASPGEFLAADEPR
jgi:hypothetical protein